MSTFNTVTNTSTDTIYVTGDWEMSTPPYDRYETAYAAAALGSTWNGFATPMFTREVLDVFVARQNALAAATPETDWDHLSVVDDVLIRTSDNYPDEEPERIESQVVNGVKVWPVDLGWTWGTLGEDNIYPVVRYVGGPKAGPKAEPETVRVAVYLTLTPEQFALFSDEADLESSIVARLDEFYDAQENVVQPKVLGIEIG